MNVYSETMFARNTSRAEYGASGLFAFGDEVISCSNPLFTPSELAVMCSPTAITPEPLYYPELTGTNNIHILAARRSVETRSAC